MSDIAHIPVYLIAFLVALGCSSVLTPMVRVLAIRWNILDHPSTAVKTHRTATPYLGGLAIALASFAALIVIRLWTDFPTGTLHSLRGMMIGGSLVLLLGLVDDIKPGGLWYGWKFAGQTVAAICVMSFDIGIHFLKPWWFADVMTVLWFVTIMNAVNIIDIMDGLASGVAAIACAGFLFVSLPSELIYVNVLSAALAGGIVGFMPFNFSRGRKIFMGDTGSLFLGFMLASLSLGTQYTAVNNLAVFAPILILAIPIFDTALVSVLRIQQGISPFLGSKDHFALRLEKMGFYRTEIVAMTYAAAILLTFIAYQITRSSFEMAAVLYVCVVVGATGVGAWLARVKMT